jgi:prolipoprotein diacylglyceryltransferase
MGFLVSQVLYDHYVFMYVFIYLFIYSIYRHINEYKRKTDSQVQMFEIIQDIDNCPVSTCVIRHVLHNVTNRRRFDISFYSFSLMFYLLIVHALQKWMALN